MKIKTVLFDLDGTLLPMDLSAFTRAYLGAIVRRLAGYGYEPKKLSDAILAGTYSIVKNDGAESNERVFWNKMVEIYGQAILSDMPRFEEFYIEEFDTLKSVCGYDPKAAITVRKIKEMGLRVALATNPLFPSIATEKRLSWTGLSPDEFECLTSYENSRFAKPSLNYYLDLIKKLNVDPENTLMVGNDVDEDMVASRIGMQVFLLTDNIINRSESDVSQFPRGGYDELLDFIKTNI